MPESDKSENFFFFKKKIALFLPIHWRLMQQVASSSE